MMSVLDRVGLPPCVAWKVQRSAHGGAAGAALCALRLMATFELLQDTTSFAVKASYPLTAATIIGRESLGIADKRLSRKQLIVSELPDGSFTVQRMGPNASFYQAGSSSAKVALPKEAIVPLPAGVLLFLAQHPESGEFQYPARVSVPGGGAQPAAAPAASPAAAAHPLTTVDSHPLEQRPQHLVDPPATEHEARGFADPFWQKQARAICERRMPRLRERCAQLEDTP